MGSEKSLPNATQTQEDSTPVNPVSPSQTAGLGGAFMGMLRREMTLAWRNRAEISNPLIFFVLVVSMFPLGVGPARETLQVLAPGLIWVVALLATLLSIDALFRSDFDDGALEQMLVGSQPLYVLVLAKVLSHWLTTGLPLVLLSPLLGTMLYLSSAGIEAMVISLLLGTGTMSLLGSIGAALTVGLRKGGILLSLIIMPLYIPVLIFGSAAVKAAVAGVPYNGHLMILAALLVGALTLTPLAAAGALRVSANG